MSGTDALLVLGMHRSGTSALAGALARLGVPLGKRLVEAGPDNPTGYFENADAVTIDERLLHALGRGWDDLREFDAGWMASVEAMHARDALHAMLEDQFSGASLWALKDPRMCRLLPLWLEVLGARGITPRCLFVVRDPSQVAASLRQRDAMDEHYALLLWCQHLLLAERDSRRCWRVMLSYESLLSRPVEVMDRIANLLEIRWPVSPANADAGLDRFLRTDQQHHRESAGCVSGEISDLARYLFDTCREVEAHGEGWEKLACVLPQFLQLRTRLVSGLDGWLDALSRVRARYDACERQLYETDRSLREVTDLSLSRMGELEVQASKLDEVHAALEAVKAQSLERMTLIEAQAAKMDEVHAAFEVVKAQSLERLTTIEAQAAKLDEVHTALEVVKAQSLERLAIIEAQAAKLDAVHAALESVKQLSLDRLHTIETQSGRLVELQAAIQALTREIEGRDRQIEAVKEYLAQRVAELTRARSDWAALRDELDRVYRSRSWRLTRPLRGVAHWLRRFRKPRT